MAEDISPDDATVVAGDRTLRLSSHAIRRMSERAITTETVAAAIADGESFRYFHEGVWKDGYYDRSSGVFLGVIDDLVTTVIRGASESYVANLRAGAP